MASISLKALTKTYGSTAVLHALDLDVADGEFVVLVGPSGCGKSTTLRLVAGLEDPSSGEIRIGGNLVNHLDPKARNVAMVFQNYAIYPHLSVRKNIGFGLRTSKLARPEREGRIEEVAAILAMTDLLDRRPSQLSGGQRQRVAIGRAMVRDPSVFLFDEPLSNLDAQLRTQMRLEIKKLHQRVGATMIFVTHDQVEAMTMADRIVIMKDGHIQQTGTPEEVYHSPANVFVAQFIGAPSMNLMPAGIEGGSVILPGGAVFEAPLAGAAGTGSVTLGIRPSDLRVLADDDARAAVLEGIVSVIEPLGSETLAHVSVQGHELVAQASGRHPPAPGQIVRIWADPAETHLFDAGTGAALHG